MFFELFNIVFESNFEIPEIPASNTSRHAVWRITLDKKTRPNIESPFYDWVHEWNEPSIQIARNPSGFLIRFPTVADFCICAEAGEIRINTSVTVNSTLIRHLLLDQVIPRLIGQIGKLVLHSSAALTKTGKCVVFLGHSGYGKSTLAAACAKNGGNVLADDSVCMEFDGKRTFISPSYAGLRLNADSLSILSDDRSVFSELDNYSLKTRLIPKTSQKIYFENKYTVDGIFLLRDPKSNTPNAPTARPCNTSDINRLIGALFMIDPTDKSNNILLYKQLMMLLKQKNLTYALNTKHDYQQLESVIALIDSVLG